jgi:heat shock protein HslJ
MRMWFALPVIACALAACGSASASDPLLGTSWHLTGITSMAPGEEPNTTIADPSRYTVNFGPDGRAAFQVDCNRGSSTWQAAAAAPDSGTLSFGPIALTRMFCPQPSDDTKVAAALSRVRSYLISDGKLHMSLEADGGVMNWAPAP